MPKLRKKPAKKIECVEGAKAALAFDRAMGKLLKPQPVQKKQQR